MRTSHDARLEKLNLQIAQLLQSPQRGTLMLHSGALYGAPAGTPSTLPTPYYEGNARRTACCAR
eukprot:1302846-Prymnesium_polylepis.1